MGQPASIRVDAAGDGEFTGHVDSLSPATGATFAEYVLDLARDHHAYFSSLPLSAEKAEFFAATAARSLEETEALEAKADVSFADYLERYSATL